LTLKNNCHNFKEIQASRGYATSSSVFVFNGIIGVTGAPISLFRRFHGSELIFLKPETFICLTPET
jgi:hypothetical protein